MSTLSDKARMDIFIHFNLLVPVGNRCCDRHMDGTGSSRRVKEGIEITANAMPISKTSGDELATFLENLRTKLASKPGHSPCISIDDEDALSDEDYTNLFGINKAQFKDLVSSLTTLRDTHNRYGKN